MLWIWKEVDESFNFSSLDSLPSHRFTPQSWVIPCMLCACSLRDKLGIPATLFRISGNCKGMDGWSYTVLLPNTPPMKIIHLRANHTHIHSQRHTASIV